MAEFRNLRAADAIDGEYLSHYPHGTSGESRVDITLEVVDHDSRGLLLPRPTMRARIDESAWVYGFERVVAEAMRLAKRRNITIPDLPE